jgi:hypothetical protein
VYPDGVSPISVTRYLFPDRCPLIIFPDWCPPTVLPEVCPRGLSPEGCAPMWVPRGYSPFFFYPLLNPHFCFARCGSSCVCPTGSVAQGVSPWCVNRGVFPVCFPTWIFFFVWSFVRFLLLEVLRRGSLQGFYLNCVRKGCPARVVTLGVSPVVCPASCSPKECSPWVFPLVCY